MGGPHLSHILQHSHPSQLLLDEPKVVDFVPELGTINSMIHLEEGTWVLLWVSPRERSHGPSCLSHTRRTPKLAGQELLLLGVGEPLVWGPSARGQGLFRPRLGTLRQGAHRLGDDGSHGACKGCRHAKPSVVEDVHGHFKATPDLAQHVL